VRAVAEPDGLMRKGFVVVCERNVLRLAWCHHDIVEEIRHSAESGRLFVRLWYLHSFAWQTFLDTEWPESNMKAIFFFELIAEKELLCPWSVPVCKTSL